VQEVMHAQLGGVNRQTQDLESTGNWLSYQSFVKIRMDGIG
jgi:hypothetical protein